MTAQAMWTRRPFAASGLHSARSCGVQQPRSVRAHATPTTTVAPGYTSLAEALQVYTDAPPSEKFGVSKGVLTAMETLKAAGTTKKWGAGVEVPLARRNVFQGELSRVGIKQPGQMAQGSVRNDAAFITAVVGVTSIVAVLAGQLPGDWGFFSSYLIGGISLVVLAIGSTAPGILQLAIDSFSLVFPDYKERVVKHEAAHFLIGYLVGLPVTGYSLLMGSQHTEFAETKIGKRIIERQLEDVEIDCFSLVAVAGIAAEGQAYEEVMGQMADLTDLQRFMLRSKTRLNDAQQQNLTRWAVLNAALMLTKYKKEHEAVIVAMQRGAPVIDCVMAIETA